MIRPALLALMLGIVLSASVMAGVQDVPMASRLLLGLGLVCLAGSVAVAIRVRPRSRTNWRARR